MGEDCPAGARRIGGVMTNFIRSVQIRFAHCDSAGIAFFPRLFELLNAGVEDLFAACGHDFRRLHVEDGFAIPSVEVNATFLAPMRLGDLMRHTLAVDALGVSSCTLQHAMSVDNRQTAAFQQTLVCVRKDSIKPVPWPNALRDALTHYQKVSP
jgi:4-hydroxybenzoyl-CoA thioesterase